MNRQEVIQMQTDEIMDEFDFGFVRKIFEENKWTYRGEFDTPSLGDLRQMAKSVIRAAAEDKYCSSGRFTAICIEDSDEKWPRLELMFTPVKWSIDEGGTYE